MDRTTKTIKEKNEIYSGTVDVDVDFQENLSTYHDDMLKIIRCSVNNYVVSYDYSNGNLTVYGKSKICLTYVSETTKVLSTADFEEDFQKTISVGVMCDNVCADIRLCNRYYNYRVINQRRIDIHNAFSLSVVIFADKEVEMIDSEENILLKKETIESFSLIATTYSKSDFEDISIVPDDSESISKIINVFSDLSLEEVKVIKDKMLIKSKVNLSFLYTTDTENQIIRKCEKTISSSKIVDVSGVEEDDVPLVKLSLGNIYAKPKADENNLLKVIEIIGDINISVMAFRKEMVTLSTDAYSIEKDVTDDFNSISLFTNGNAVADSKSFDYIFDFENINIVEVLDLKLSAISKKEVELNAIVMNDNSEIVHLSSRKEIDIETYKIMNTYVSSFDYIIKSYQAIGVRFTISYYGFVYEEKSFNLLTDIAESESECKEPPALVVYFAKEHETIWEIAKKFKSSVELIKEENEIEEDVLSSHRVLLIPGM